MILVDTSVWVDHLRVGDPKLIALLERAAVATHPFVVGEVACGSLRNRPLILGLLQNLPVVKVADNGEVLSFIEHHALHGRAIGYVDVHLLASTLLTPGAQLWTKDKRLLTAAKALGCALPLSQAH